MAMMNLSEGAITKITSGGATASNLKPTLQVTELKQVQTKQPQQSKVTVKSFLWVYLGFV